MRILMINSCCGIESTGRICADLAFALKKQGNEVKIAYGRGIVPDKCKEFAVKIGNDLDVYKHVAVSRFFDRTGFGSKRATKRLINWIEDYDPDVIHLHNIHGYYINIELLFNYLAVAGKRVIWTLHDCWSFTGHCAYFDMIGCDKWKTMCKQCYQKSEYPKRFFVDNSSRNYIDKKKLFTSVKDMLLVTPSDWLKGLVEQSFLSKYPVITIHNGINTEFFKPTPSSLRTKYNLGKKIVVLGVASVWDKRKGLDYFVRLSERLDGTKYQIILVGVTKKQKQNLPNSIIAIERTNNVSELAEFYSMADIYVNPTLEDNYPTTNLEAIACGTPVISFKTGGSVESAQIYGVSVDNNTDDLIQAILQQKFEKNDSIYLDYRCAVKEYMNLYNTVFRGE